MASTKRPPLLPTGDKTLDRFRSSHVGRSVNNPTLSYAKADTDAVPIPLAPSSSGGGGGKGSSSAVPDLLRAIRDLYEFRAKPPRQFKTVDYFVAATRLFLDEVTEEYAQQAAKRAREKKPYQRFVWANTGQLAINYALACDCAKQLCDRLVFTPTNYKPAFDFFMATYIEFLIDLSGIPQDILQPKTYDVKLKDWKKGGTRYNTATGGGDADAAGDSATVTNVRFPAARQRREKLESYLKGADEVVEIESSRVEVAAASGKVVAVTAVHSRSNAEADPVAADLLLSSGAGGGATTGNSNSGSNLVGVVSADGTIVFVPAPKGSVAAGGSGAAPPAARAAIKSALRPLSVSPWRQSIFRLLGGSIVPYYPLDRIGSMGAFVAAAEGAPERGDRQYILRLLTESSVHNSIVLEAFDLSRGLLVLRAWAFTACGRSDLFLLHAIVEFAANRFDCYSPETKAGWAALTPLQAEVVMADRAKEKEKEKENKTESGDVGAAPSDICEADADDSSALPPNTTEFIRAALRRLPVAAAEENARLVEHIVAYLGKIQTKLLTVPYSAGWGAARGSAASAAAASAPVGAGAANSNGSAAAGGGSDLAGSDGTVSGMLRRLGESAAGRSTAATATAGGLSGGSGQQLSFAQQHLAMQQQRLQQQKLQAPSEQQRREAAAAAQQEAVARLLTHWGGGGKTADLPIISGPLPRLEASTFLLPAELRPLQRLYLSEGALTSSHHSGTAPANAVAKKEEEKTEVKIEGEDGVAAETSVGATERAALEAVLAAYVSERQYSLYERLAEGLGLFAPADSPSSAEGQQMKTGGSSATAASPALRSPSTVRAVAAAAGLSALAGGGLFDFGAGGLGGGSDTAGLAAVEVASSAALGAAKRGRTDATDETEATTSPSATKGGLRSEADGSAAPLLSATASSPSSSSSPPLAAQQALWELTPLWYNPYDLLAAASAWAPSASIAGRGGATAQSGSAPTFLIV